MDDAGGSAHQAGGQGPSLTGVSFPDLTVHCLRAFPSQTWKGTRHRSIAASENQVGPLLKQENIRGFPGKAVPRYPSPQMPSSEVPADPLTTKFGPLPSFRRPGLTSVTQLEV